MAYTAYLFPTYTVVTDQPAEGSPLDSIPVPDEVALRVLEGASFEIVNGTVVLVEE